MTHGSPQRSTQNPFIEDHDHNAIVWDATTCSYVCTTCGLVLEGVPPQICEHERPWPKTNGQGYEKHHYAWLDRKGIGMGALILEQDLLKLSLRKRELFQRLYQIHRKVNRIFWQDRRKSAFNCFLHQLSQDPAYRAAFPAGHPKTSKLLETFSKCCQIYADRNGCQTLHNATKIRIFLALIQPHLDSMTFRDFVTQMGETTLAAVYKVRKKLGDWGTCATVNAQRKCEFIEQAKQLVRAAAIDPKTKNLAEDILAKRVRVKGLIVRKRPAILAAAALFVAASHGNSERVSKQRIQHLVGVSYIPQETIEDCRKLLEMDNEEFISREHQEFLMGCLNQRSDLFETRRALRSQLADETKKTFPELGEILKLRNVSTLKLLKQYPSTVDIAKLDLDELVTFLKKHSRRKLRDIDQLAARLLTEARKNETVGRCRPRPGNQAMIRSLVKALEHVESQRRELERQLLKAIGEEGRALMRTPGIGLITATTMILSRGFPTTQPPFAHQESFFQRRLQDAIRILQRNKLLRHQYPEWLDPKVPRVEAIQQMMNQLLQPQPPPLSPLGL